MINWIINKLKKQNNIVSLKIDPGTMNELVKVNKDYLTIDDLICARNKSIYNNFKIFKCGFEELNKNIFNLKIKIKEKIHMSNNEFLYSDNTFNTTISKSDIYLNNEIYSCIEIFDAVNQYYNYYIKENIFNLFENASYIKLLEPDIEYDSYIEALTKACIYYFNSFELKNTEDEEKIILPKYNVLRVMSMKIFDNYNKLVDFNEIKLEIYDNLGYLVSTEHVYCEGCSCRSYLHNLEDISNKYYNLYKNFKIIILDKENFIYDRIDLQDFRGKYKIEINNWGENDVQLV